MKPQSVERATARFAHLGFQVTTGARYLGGYVGDTTDQAKYIDAKVTEWTDGICRLSTIARSSPQCSFIALQKSYQQEWMHLQRVVDGISSHFAPVEAALCTRFLPSLLGGTTPTTIPLSFVPSSPSPSNHPASASPSLPPPPMIATSPPQPAPLSSPTASLNPLPSPWETITQQ